MVRTPTVILAPCSGTSNGTSSSVPCRAFLHYIAVMIANAGRENAPSLPSAFVSGEPAPKRVRMVLRRVHGAGRTSGRDLGRKAASGSCCLRQGKEKLRSIILFRCRAAGDP
ncbi:hypothetical protein [Streptomyces rochei]|uniref:hypothetical protein n=1 Tax=Streptomyces rochei TaxID=1928 RepID=UPI0034D4324D